jgi:hypothetical protein
MVDEDRFGYEEEEDEKDDDEHDDISFGDKDDDDDNFFNDDDGDIADIEHNLPFVYQTPSRWKLPSRDNVLKAAKSIIAYTQNVLSERGKGPITSSEKDDVERITSLGLEVVERAYDIYKQRVGEVVELFPMSSSHSKEPGVYFLQRPNVDSKVG